MAMLISHSTASLSHLRTMLPESSSCLQPAQRPNHATQSLFDSKTRYLATKLEKPAAPFKAYTNPPDNQCTVISCALTSNQFLGRHCLLSPSCLHIHPIADADVRGNVQAQMFPIKHDKRWMIIAGSFHSLRQQTLITTSFEQEILKNFTISLP